MKTHDLQSIIFSNGFSFDLLGEADRFLGIGAVRFQGTALRAAKIPWLIYTESEHGLGFDPTRLEAVERSGEAVTLVIAAEGRWLPRVQEADAMGDARIRTRRAAVAAITLRWTFRPVIERIFENDWAGLAMQVTAFCPGHPIHWLLEDTTWEIGGHAEGCTLIQQDIATMDLEQEVKADSAFSTIEKFFTDGWGGAYPMDMLPRCAGASICDFQVKGDVALCLYAEKPGLTRARLEKFADEDLIHYTDRPFFKLGENVSAPERKLLVHRAPARLARHEWRNLWLDCFAHVRARIHAAYGFRLETPRPMIHAHLWDAELKQRGARWIEDLAAALPLYRRLGYLDVFTHGVWESVTSDPTRGLEDGNICSPYRFRFAAAFGGETGMRVLAAAAGAAGIGLFQWYSFHLSKYAPVWKEHPDWMLREANGDPYDAGYVILVAGRMNSPYGQWFEDDIRHSCAAAGTQGIFWDSYQNLGLSAVDWGAPDKAPQAERIWAMQARQQAAGLRHRPEITTIFGVSQVGMFGFAADRFRRRLWDDAVSGDHAFALLDTSPGFFSSRDPFGSGVLDADRYFWLAAHRCLPAVGARPWPALAGADASGSALPGGDQVEEFARVNHLYNQALPRKHRLRLVPDGSHVLWLDETGVPAIVWAFRDSEVAVAKPFAARAGEVYAIGGDGTALALALPQIPVETR